MNLFRSVRAVADASESGVGIVDWESVAEAAKGATNPGSLSMSDGERQGYAADVRAARDAIREVSGVEFELPTRIEVQDRHHWIDANAATFERVMRPLEDQTGRMFPGVARSVNTGTMAFALSFLSRNVLGQYDPLLLADAPDTDHGLYFVRPNVRTVAVELDVDYERFRRWIAFHEVAHAAEFAAAPWLSEYMEDRVAESVEALAAGTVRQEAFAQINTAMTAVEGYAELLMDLAFDDEYSDLRRKLDARRQGGGPVMKLIRRLLGLGVKRRQYERGVAFFETICRDHGVATASRVWERPENLPTETELDDPDRWLARLD